jgi:DNA-binding transcriptional LysR family regulator
VRHDPDVAGAVRSADIGELRAFCVAADLGSLGRAAVALHTSQPAISKRLRTLEALAGTQLLERSRKGVSLTGAGKRLYPEARKLLDQADVISHLLGGFEEAGAVIRLAVSHTVAEFLLPPELVALDGLEEKHPPVEVMAANSRTVRRLVADGRADLGIAANWLPSDPDERLEELELRADEIVLAVPQTHPWYGRTSIPEAAFLRTPLIVRDPGAHSRGLVDAVLASKREHLAPPLLEVGNTAAAKREAVDLGAPILISALALDERRDRLYRRPVEGLRFPRRFVIVCRSQSNLTPEERELIAFFQRRLLPVVPSPPSGP